MKQAFFEICRRVGERVPGWVQGAGGNVSQKYDRNNQTILRIKASGYRLEHVNDQQGYVDLDLKAAQEAMFALRDLDDREEAYSRLLKDSVLSAPKTGDRASMETSFHIGIEAPLVVHFHSLAAVLLADRYFAQDPRALSFARGLPDTAFVSFYKPGLDLAFAIMNARKSSLYILQNHGVVLAMNEPAELDAWIDLELKIMSEFGWENLHSADEVTECQPLKVYLPDTAVFLEKFQNSLEEDSIRKGHFRLMSSDKNLSEIWKATARMHAAYPALEQIPEPLWNDIAGLPSEKFRLNLQKGDR